MQASKEPGTTRDRSTPMAGTPVASRPTLQSIAALVGVSKPTVSRILNGRHREIGIRDDLAERVRIVAAQCGYRPNAAARATSVGRHMNVALVVGTRPFTSHLPSRLLGALHDALDRHGYHLMLAHLSDERLTDPAFLPGFLRSWLCDGLLIDYNAGIPKRLLDLIAHQRMPAVWINAKLPRCAVHPDDLGAGRRATEALLAAGHERIAYLDASLGPARSADVLHYSKLDRRDGYLAAMHHAGRKPLLLVNRADGPLDAYVERTTQRLLGREGPTAFVAYSDFESRLLGLPLAEKGCRIGRDLVGFTFRSESDVQSYPFRTPALRVPETDMAEAAVALLLEAFDHPGDPPTSRAIPFLDGLQDVPTRDTHTDTGG